MSSRPRHPLQTMALLPALPLPLMAALLLVACLILPGCTRPYSLTILHTNDIHSRLTQFDKYGQLCAQNSHKNCSGGMARIAAAALAERTNTSNVLLLDAGDQFQGSLYFSRFKGQAAATLMNTAGYDAMVVGNHEFDAGAQVLADFAKALHFPLLACNVDASTTSPLHGQTQRHVVLKRGGRSIGIIGVVTPETAFLSSPDTDLRFNEPADCLKQSVCELQAQGVEIIIALSHNGYGVDLQLARSVEGLDMIVGGHSHTRLGTWANAAGPYPTVVRSPSGQPVLVVQAGQWGRELGRICVEFDESGIPVAWSDQPLILDTSQPRAADVVSLAQSFQTELATFRSTIVGSLPDRIDASKKLCRFGECRLGNLVADAALAVGRPAGAQAALINSGGIRAGLPAGEITLGNVLTALPFSNEILVTDLPGQALLNVLEHGVSRADGSHDAGTGRFLQTSGLRYSWSKFRPQGQRILQAEIHDGHLWLPIKPNGTYRVALPNYLLGGGDGYAMLKPFAAEAYTTSLSTADALREYLKKHNPLIPPGVGSRIKTLP